MKFRASLFSPQKKYRQPRNYFFPNSAGRIILSTLFRSPLVFLLLFWFARTLRRRQSSCGQSTGLDGIVQVENSANSKGTKILLADESFGAKKRLDPTISQHIRPPLIIYCFAVYILSIFSIYLQRSAYKTKNNKLEKLKEDSLRKINNLN